MPSVFLSHSSKDKFFAQKIAETLRLYGVTVWIDEAEIKIGDSLIDKISKAIDAVDYIAVLLSHNSVNSPWVQKELQIAMTKEIGEKTVIVLPILIEQCPIPPYLSDKLYADFTDAENFEAPLSKLLHALGVAKPTVIPSTPPPKTVKQPTPVVPVVEPELEGFVDVKIKRLDKSRLYKPDPEMALYHVYFELSVHPPQEWVQIFEAERQFPRHTMWRHAWIEDKYIVVHCAPEEVKKYHLNDIKEDVDNSNTKYREYLRKVSAARAREAQREEKEREQVDSAFEDLDFE